MADVYLHETSKQAFELPGCSSQDHTASTQAAQQRPTTVINSLGRCLIITENCGSAPPRPIASVTQLGPLSLLVILQSFAKTLMSTRNGFFRERSTASSSSLYVASRVRSRKRKLSLSQAYTLFSFKAKRESPMVTCRAANVACVHGRSSAVEKEGFQVATRMHGNSSLPLLLPPNTQAQRRFPWILIAVPEPLMLLYHAFPTPNRRTIGRRRRQDKAIPPISESTFLLHEHQLLCFQAAVWLFRKNRFQYPGLTRARGRKFSTCRKPYCFSCGPLVMEIQVVVSLRL